MSFWLTVADKLGFFNKLRTWLQGKKTYLVNTIQILIGLGAILALTGQVLDLVVQTLSLFIGWSDPASLGPQVSSESAFQTIKDIWSNHAVLTAGYSVAWYSILDALSKMSAYAASQRRIQELKTVIPTSPVAPIAPGEIK